MKTSNQLTKRRWWHWLFPPRLPGYSIRVHPRDESATRALDELNDRAINRAANVLAQSNDHIQHFFIQLRQELAFYLGCINLHDRLKGLNQPVAYPAVAPLGTNRYSATALYDPCLALSMVKPVTGNDLDADHRKLVIVTGANRGGKSTFLRSIGIAQLMMQSGMFVPATAFGSSLVSQVFTHFKKEEDRSMQSGKFDEELGRMDSIADHLVAGSLLLFNESFAATNEREGSEIAAQIVNALIEKGVRVFFVTHLSGFAHAFYEKQLEDVVFLRAQRMPDASRNFKITEGRPLATSYGPDLYMKVFNGSASK